jgi:hypothetical protein
MVTEPLEALIALLLISIILASIFIYNQRGTERLFTKRTLTRSIAGAVSGMYLNYLNNTQIFRDFNESVANFLTYVEKKENVSCSAVLRLIFKNGSYFNYPLIRGKELANSINESIVIAYGNNSGNLHVYAIANRSFISSLPGNPSGIYVVAYYDNGISALYAGTAGSDTPPYIVVRYSNEIILSKQCNQFSNGRATCDISANYWPSQYQGISGTLKIEIYYYNIDGIYSGLITFEYPAQAAGYSKNEKVMIADVDANGNRYLHYYLGEIVNFTTDVNSWSITNRKGAVCKSSMLGNKIPTGTSYLCVDAGNIPLPVFLVQGPVNITLNYDATDDKKSIQVIFIDPYFTQIFVRTSFRR